MSDARRARVCWVGAMAAACGVFVAMNLILASCGGGAGGWGGGGGRGARGGGGGVGRVDVSGTPGQIEGLMPEELVLHPLTRVGNDLNGTPAIICHIELKDQFGQTVKALGALRVELQQRAGVGSSSATGASGAAAGEATAGDPTGGGAAQPETVDAERTGAGWSRGVVPAEQTRQEVVWEVDLRDARENARYFDDLVTRTYTVALGGVPAWVVEWSRDPRSQSAGPTLVATFTFGDGSGGVRTLSAGARLLK